MPQDQEVEDSKGYFRLLGILEELLAIKQWLCTFLLWNGQSILQSSSPKHLSIMTSEGPLAPLPQALYRYLGQTGLRVSLPILGGMGMGDKRVIPWVLEEEEAMPILKAAYDRGLNTWDTSSSYVSIPHLNCYHSCETFRRVSQLATASTGTPKYSNY